MSCYVPAQIYTCCNTGATLLTQAPPVPYRVSKKRPSLFRRITSLISIPLRGIMGVSRLRHSGRIRGQLAGTSLRMFCALAQPLVGNPNLGCRRHLAVNTAPFCILTCLPGLLLFLEVTYLVTAGPWNALPPLAGFAPQLNPHGTACDEPTWHSL